MTTATAPNVTAPPALTAAPAPSAAPVAPAAAAPASAAPAPAAWMEGFSDDLRGYIGLKGFKDPATLADSYRNFEKLQGVPQDRLMKLPEQVYDDKGNLTAEGRGIYERLGAPKEMKDYGIEAPKENADPKRLESFLKAAHDIGLTKSQAQKLAAADTEYYGGLMNAAKEAHTIKFNDQKAALSREWGAAHDQNTNIAKEAVRTMGISAAQVDGIANVLGHAETMKLFHKLGRQVGELPFVGGARGDGLLEPATAVAKIKELAADKSFADKLFAGDAESKKKWDHLHQMAYQGNINL